MYPLKLQAHFGNWSLFIGRKQDPAFAPFSQRVLNRDAYTCQFCGFQAREHQEVINLDGNYHNNKITNLVTACILCAQCHFLDAVGALYGGGRLICLPDMSQAELNSFSHVLFCAMANRTNYMDTAQNTYRTLRFRSQLVDDKFGEGMSEPRNFCQMLLNVDETLDQDLIFKDLRLLPLYAKFKDQLSDWAAAAVAELAQKD